MVGDLVGDHELADFRRQYYGLLAQLLAREPTAQLLAALGQGIAARAQAARALHPALGDGWDAVAAVLGTLDTAAAAAEYLRLFIGPFEPRVMPYESHYLAGAVYRMPLVSVRDFLRQIGLERDTERFSEPEDMLAFELEVMRWLIEGQRNAGDPVREEAWLRHQTAFLAEHLLIWAPACARDIAAAPEAVLYRAVAKVLAAFLEWDRQVFRGRGLDKVETLETARRRYTSGSAWRGALYEPEKLDPHAKPPEKTG